MSKISQALAMCVELHRNQIDRDGLPHSLHCIRIALKQDTESRMIVALLHDIPEDCGMEYIDVIQKEFGRQVAASVRLLTRKDGATEWMGHVKELVSPPHHIFHFFNGQHDKTTELLARRAQEDALHVKLHDIEDKVLPRRLDEKVKKHLPMYHEGYSIVARALGYTDRVLPI